MSLQVQSVDGALLLWFQWQVRGGGSAMNRRVPGSAAAAAKAAAGLERPSAPQSGARRSMGLVIGQVGKPGPRAPAVAKTLRVKADASASENVRRLADETRAMEEQLVQLQRRLAEERRGRPKPGQVRWSSAHDGPLYKLPPNYVRMNKPRRRPKSAGRTMRAPPASPKPLNTADATSEAPSTTAAAAATGSPVPPPTQADTQRLNAGEFDEAASKQSFADALAEWRRKRAVEKDQCNDHDDDNNNDDKDGAGNSKPNTANSSSSITNSSEQHQPSRTWQPRRHRPASATQTTSTGTTTTTTTPAASSGLARATSMPEIRFSRTSSLSYFERLLLAKLRNEAKARDSTEQRNLARDSLEMRQDAQATSVSPPDAAA